MGVVRIFFLVSPAVQRHARARVLTTSCCDSNSSFLRGRGGCWGLRGGKTSTQQQQPQQRQQRHQKHTIPCCPLTSCCCTTPAQHQQPPAPVEASFSTLLDDEEEGEYEFDPTNSELEELMVEDDVDETLLVDNLGLSEEVGVVVCCCCSCC